MSQVIVGPRKGTRIVNNGGEYRVGDKLTSDDAKALKDAGWTIKNVPDDQAESPEVQVKSVYQPAPQVEMDALSIGFKDSLADAPEAPADPEAPTNDDSQSPGNASE